MFVHKNWNKTDVLEKFAAQTAKRSLKDLTIGPVITWTNEEIKGHIDACMELDGAEILFGGAPLKNHTIPSKYGSYEPTAIKIPLKHLRAKKKRELITKELFGPSAIVSEYANKDIDFLLDVLEGLPHHLTAACVSNDPLFNDRIMSRTLNGT